MVLFRSLLSITIISSAASFHSPAYSSSSLHQKHVITGMMTSKNNCVTKTADDDLLPEMYSTIDEINRHLRRHNGSIIPATDKDNNYASSSSSATNKEAAKRPPLPHLFLHFDVNETILLGDPAGGDSVHECINKIIAKSAFVSTSGMLNDHHHRDADDSTTKQPPMITRSPSSGNICDTHQFEPTHWWNGVSINDTTDTDDDFTSLSSPTPPPPLYTGWTYPPNCCPYYRTKYKQHAKKFTSTPHGQVYRPLYDKLCRKMGLDGTNDNDKDGKGSSHVQQSNEEVNVFQNFLPAFWQTLMYYFPSSTKMNTSNNNNNNDDDDESALKARRKVPPPPKVTLVLRTFGTDLPRVATAISEFAKGNHPDYPNYINEDLILEDGDLYCSGWSYIHNHDDDKEELVYSLHRATNDNQEGTTTTTTTPVYSGDDDILNLLQSKHIVGIQDNYPFWRDNNHAPWAGKPVWTNTSVHGHDHHHVLLDDNIHNDPTDGAGGIRVPIVVENGKGGGGGVGVVGGNNNCYNRYESLHGEEALNLHGRYLIRVPTIRPSLEDDWFIRQIEMARWLVQLDDIND